MCQWECSQASCLSRRRFQRGLAPLFLALGVLWAGMSLAQEPPTPILPPDAAARAFDTGRQALKKSAYQEAIRSFKEALATGHTRPAARLGTNRYFVERYDPHYGLGVAFMETGDRERALESFRRSISYGLIQQWPEWSDISSRLRDLETTAAILAKPPVASSTPAPAILTVVATPSPVPTEATSPAARTSQPFSQPAETASPVPSVATRIPLPPENTLPECREALRRAIDAMGRADWTQAVNFLEEVKRKQPGLAQTALLRAVAFGSRYLLEGRREEDLRLAAKESLEEYRRLGGKSDLELIWLSPALSAVLNR